MHPIRDAVSLNAAQLQVVIAGLARNAELLEAIGQAWQTPTASSTFLLDANLNLKAIAGDARHAMLAALLVILDSLHAAIPEDKREDVDAKLRAAVARLYP